MQFIPSIGETVVCLVFSVSLPNWDTKWSLKIEIWSSLRVTNGKLYHSGAPKTPVGLYPFTPMYNPIEIDWKNGQPKSGVGNCVSITQDKNATMAYCYTPLFMYCQRFPVIPSVSTEPTFCPEGYVGNINWPICYKFNQEHVSYSQAAINCQKEGAELLSINGSLLSTGLDFPSADAEMIKEVNFYYRNILGTNQEISPNVVYWFKNTGNAESCSVIEFLESRTSYRISDACNITMMFMCTKEGRVNTGRDMQVRVEVKKDEFSEVQRYSTYCNLSRDLLPGENVYISVNDIPIIDIYQQAGMLYVGGHSQIYPEIKRIGKHKCEVRGLHNKQIWSAEMYFQPPDAVLFIGTVDVAPLLPDVDVLKYNLATVQQPQMSEDRIITSYRLRQQWLSITSQLNEMYITQPVLKGQFTSEITEFSNNGGRAEFLISLNYDGEYSTVMEHTTKLQMYSFIIDQLKGSNPGKRKKRVVSSYSFIPSSLKIQSSRICAGSYYFEDTDTTVNFQPVTYGSSAITTEICITDKKPLATADCVGGPGQPTQLVNVVMNPRCRFSRLPKSPVTDILTNLTTITIDDKNRQGVIDTLKNITTDTEEFTVIDTINTADVLVHVTNTTTIDETAVKNVLEIIDSVVGIDKETLNKAQNEGSATNRILEVLETIQQTVDLKNKTSIQYLGPNILMDIYEVSDMVSPVIGIEIMGGTSQPLTSSTIETLLSDTNVTVQGIDAAIILPIEILEGNASTRVSLNIYRNWNLFGVRSDIREYKPNSRVIAASITVNGTNIKSLGEYNVKTIFFPRMESENSECGYWDYELHDNSGGWATDGCYLNRTESGRLICVCDHLTNFAVLVNIGGQDNLEDGLAIHIITWIGLILSIIGLSLTILSFVLFRQLRKGRAQQTLFNLALSLLCSLVVFLAGIHQTQDYFGCIAVAVLLHYFILVAFMWMLMEGILQYLRFVKVLGTYIPNFILKSAVPAWGVPLIPVIVVLAVDYNMYHGGVKGCWMSLSSFYLAFVLPVCMIMAANIIIFILILKNLLGRPKGLQSNQSERKRAVMNLRAAFSVFVLLGLTWIFGFFTIEKASTVFQYIFTILNVFQGFLIFVIFTAREKQVRAQWKKLCCKEKPQDKYKSYDSSADKNKIKNPDSSSEPLKIKDPNYNMYNNDTTTSTGLDNSSTTYT